MFGHTDYSIDREVDVAINEAENRIFGEDCDDYESDDSEATETLRSKLLKMLGRIKRLPYNFVVPILASRPCEGLGDVEIAARKVQLDYIAYQENEKIVKKQKCNRRYTNPILSTKN